MCVQQYMASLSADERAQIQNNFGGGRGSGRQNGAQAQALRRVAGGALALRAAAIYRPFFVDVYAIEKTSDDPTYWGTDYLGYGCCGVLAKEQRTWPDTINLLTEDGIKQLRRFETEVREELQYKKFCFRISEADATGTEPQRIEYDAANASSITCALPVSITNFFWPTVSDVPAEDVDCRELYDAGSYCEYLDYDENHLKMVEDGVLRGASGENVLFNESIARIHTPDGKGSEMQSFAFVQGYLGELSDRGLLNEHYKLLLDRKFSVARPISRGLITKMVFEQPAPRFRRSAQQAEQQSSEAWLEEFDIWLKDSYMPILDRFSSENIDHLAYVPSFLETWRQEGIDQAIAWGCGALVMVYIMLWIRMRHEVGGWRRSVKHFAMSFVLPLGAIFHVLMSFPVSWAIYRYIYQQKYVGYMQFISIFIILGIGVDDVFIMYDAWVQSCSEGFAKSDLHGRMSFAWPRAARAMLITSITDSLAFLANAVSVIPAVRCFGYMMSTMVVVNYVMDVTLFPALLVLVTRWAQTNCLADKCDNHEHDVSVIAPTTIGSAAPPDSQGTSEFPQLRPRASVIERFFQERYGPFVHRFRYGILIAALLVIGGFSAALTQLQQSRRAFRFETFPDWFPMNRIFNMGNWEESGDIFGEATPVQPVFIFWGALGLDTSDADSNNPLDIGTPSLNPSFDLASPEVQESILRVCMNLRELPSTRNHQVLCPLRHFKEWYLHPDVSNNTWPIRNRTEFMEPLKFFVNMPIRSSGCRASRRGRGGYELHADGGRGCAAFFNQTGAADRAGLVYLSVKQAYTDYFGYDAIGDRVSWAMVAVNSTLSSQSSAGDSRLVYDGIQAVLGAEGGAIMQASKLWPQMVTEEAMLVAATSGAALSLAVACVTLFVFTRNCVLVMYCLVSIASVVVVTMGLLPILNWHFGFLEAMSMVFVVGFSVDFIAHVAISYQESVFNNRAAKTTEALATVGISVAWAAGTTIAAAVFLVFCVMVPFSKMGVFIIWNQLVSFVFAVLPFAAALTAFGPVREQGIIPLPRSCLAKSLLSKGDTGEGPRTSSLNNVGV